jgi:hypothetical protein
VVAHLGDDVLVAQHHQGGMGLGGGGIAARMARGLAAADLQGQVAQGIGRQQGLEDGLRGGRVGEGGLALADDRAGGQLVAARPSGGEILDAVAEIGGGQGKFGGGVHGGDSSGDQGLRPP